jgi:hypothetical protein
MKLPKILLVLCWGFMGAGLGWAIASFITEGYLTKWRELPLLPARAIHIRTFETRALEARVYIEAADTEIYSCEIWSSDCWTQRSLPVDNSFIRFTLDTCSRAWPQFFILTNPPNNGLECLNGHMLSGGEVGGPVVFLLDEEGRVWVWRQTTYWFSDFRLFLSLTSLGAVLGLTIGFFLAQPFESLVMVGCS